MGISDTANQYTVGKALIEGMKNNKSKIAFQYIKKHEIFEITYDRFLKDVRKLVQYIKRNHLSGTHIALFGDYDYSWIVTMYGIMCSGSVCVPIDKAINAEDLENRFRQADVQTVFFGKQYKDELDEADFLGMNILEICIDDCFEHGESDETANEEVEFCTDSERTCLFLFTSGTTGNNKCAMISQKNLGFVAFKDKKQYSVNENDKVIIAAPLCHAFGCCLYLEILYAGMTICINEDIRYVMRDCREMRPTIIYTVPMIAESYLLQLQNKVKGCEDSDVKHSIRVIITSGAALSNPERGIADFRKLGISILTIYGLTETLGVTYEREAERRAGSVGRVYDSVEFKLVDGELWVKGNMVCHGYYKNEEDTKASFSEGWFRTGDLVEADSENYLYITGRLKNLIIRSDGNNVSPEELEQKLRVKSPYITEVLVKQIENEIVAEVYCDLEEAKDLEKKLEEDIKELNCHLPDYKVIDRFVIRDKPFEKTASKKIKRQGS